MKSRVLFSVLLALCVHVALAQSKSQVQLDYIEQYKNIAIREMNRAGIPASIKLAQGLLESAAGQSDLARRANNHFGIKCNPEWDGKTYYKKDDDYDARGRLIESCFRVYKNPEASFVAHSEFLRDPKKIERYGFLFQLDPTDYRRWARGLRTSGYATAGDYDRKLIELIERYELHQYDRLSLVADDQLIVSGETGMGYMLNNDVKYVLAMDNEPVEEIARRTFTSVSTLLDYNENLLDRNQRLSRDAKVYLQPKRTAYRGKQVWHYVQSGETMADISNQYAVRMSSLYERNRMPDGAQPAPNERIKLRGGRTSHAPRLISEVSAVEPLSPKLIFEGWEEEVIDIKPTPSRPTTQPRPDSSAVPQPVAEHAPARPQIEEMPRPTPPVTAQPDSIQPPAPANSRSNNPARTQTSFDEDNFFDDAPPVETPTNAPVFHTVIKGDTLWNISQRYGMTVSELRTRNNLNSDSIQLGMKLRVQ